LNFLNLIKNYILFLPDFHVNDPIQYKDPYAAAPLSHVCVIGDILSISILNHPSPFLLLLMIPLSDTGRVNDHLWQIVRKNSHTIGASSIAAPADWIKERIAV
jgi:hypothetical protein